MLRRIMGQKKGRISTRQRKEIPNSKLRGDFMLSKGVDGLEESWKSREFKQLLSGKPFSGKDTDTAFDDMATKLSQFR
jgi:hypothetical protein